MTIAHRHLRRTGVVLAGFAGLEKPQISPSRQCIAGAPCLLDGNTGHGLERKREGADDAGGSRAAKTRLWEAREGSTYLENLLHVNIEKRKV